MWHIFLSEINIGNPSTHPHHPASTLRILLPFIPTQSRGYYRTHPPSSFLLGAGVTIGQTRHPLWFRCSATCGERLSPGLVYGSPSRWRCRVLHTTRYSVATRLNLEVTVGRWQNTKRGSCLLLQSSECNVWSPKLQISGLYPGKIYTLKESLQKILNTFLLTASWSGEELLAHRHCLHEHLCSHMHCACVNTNVTIFFLSLTPALPCQPPGIIPM